MATSEQQVPPKTPAADIVCIWVYLHFIAIHGPFNVHATDLFWIYLKVGNAFVDQYYHMLHESPELVHRFYQDVSKLGRPEQNGIMGITTTMLVSFL